MWQFEFKKQLKQSSSIKLDNIYKMTTENHVLKIHKIDKSDHNGKSLIRQNQKM
jgi:hypothetical protein